MKPRHSSPLARTHALPSGPVVRLRLARRADLEALRTLVRSRGAEPLDMAMLRLLTYDPTRRLVIAACAPIDGQDTLVGLGAIDLRHDAQVDSLIIDERLTEGLGELLISVLEGRAAAHGQRVA
jgi:hypothetical protein